MAKDKEDPEGVTSPEKFYCWYWEARLAKGTLVISPSQEVAGMKTPSKSIRIVSHPAWYTRDENQNLIAGPTILDFSKLPRNTVEDLELHYGRKWKDGLADYLSKNASILGCQPGRPVKPTLLTIDSEDAEDVKAFLKSRGKEAKVQSLTARNKSVFHGPMTAGG